MQPRYTICDVIQSGLAKVWWHHRLMAVWLKSSSHPDMTSLPPRTLVCLQENSMRFCYLYIKTDPDAEILNLLSSKWQWRRFAWYRDNCIESPCWYRFHVSNSKRQNIGLSSLDGGFLLASSLTMEKDKSRKVLGSLLKSESFYFLCFQWQSFCWSPAYDCGHCCPSQNSASLLVCRTGCKLVTSRINPQNNNALSVPESAAMDGWVVPLQFCLFAACHSSQTAPSLSVILVLLLSNADLPKYISPFSYVSFVRQWEM